MRYTRGAGLSHRTGEIEGRARHREAAWLLNDDRDTVVCSFLTVPDGGCREIKKPKTVDPVVLVYAVVAALRSRACRGHRAQL